MTQRPADAVVNSFRQALDQFSRTLETGLRAHEQVARFWGELAGRGVEDLRDGWRKLADHAPFATRNLDAVRRTFDAQARQALAVLGRTLELARVRDAREWADRLRSLWEASFESLREAVEDLSRRQSELARAWNDLSRQFAAGRKAASAARRPAVRPKRRRARPPRARAKAAAR